jgi:hypothetical protein
MTTHTAAPQAAKFKKGQKSGPGRPKGAQNKVSKELKEMILEALDEAGGVDYLVRQAKKKNAAAFMALVGRVLPMTLTGTGDGGAITVNIKQF